MDFRKGIISTALSLTLLTPSLVFANNGVPQENKNLIKSYSMAFEKTVSREHHPGQKPELPPEAKEKFIELKIKLKNGEITKEEFHQEMKKMMPEGSQFKQRKKDCCKKRNLSDFSTIL